MPNIRFPWSRPSFQTPPFSPQRTTASQYGTPEDDDEVGRQNAYADDAAGPDDEMFRVRRQLRDEMVSPQQPKGGFWRNIAAVALRVADSTAGGRALGAGELADELRYPGRNRRLRGLAAAVPIEAGMADDAENIRRDRAATADRNLSRQRLEQADRFRQEDQRADNARQEESRIATERNQFGAQGGRPMPLPQATHVGAVQPTPGPLPRAIPGMPPPLDAGPAPYSPPSQPVATMTSEQQLPPGSEQRTIGGVRAYRPPAADWEREKAEAKREPDEPLTITEAAEAKRLGITVPTGPLSKVERDAIREIIRLRSQERRADEREPGRITPRDRMNQADEITAQTATYYSGLEKELSAAIATLDRQIPPRMREVIPGLSAEQSASANQSKAEYERRLKQIMTAHDARKAEVEKAYQNRVGQAFGSDHSGARYAPKGTPVPQRGAPRQGSPSDAPPAEVVAQAQEGEEIVSPTGQVFVKRGGRAVPVN